MCRTHDRGERAVLQDRQVRKQIELLKHHPDVAADRKDALGVLGQIVAVDDDAPLLPVFEPVDAAKQRGLAAAGRAADNDAFTATDL